MCVLYHKTVLYTLVTYHRHNNDRTVTAQFYTHPVALVSFCEFFACLIFCFFHDKNCFDFQHDFGMYFLFNLIILVAVAFFIVN
jgi:hypothetical protein